MQNQWETLKKSYSAAQKGVFAAAALLILIGLLAVGIAKLHGGRGGETKNTEAASDSAKEPESRPESEAEESSEASETESEMPEESVPEEAVPQPEAVVPELLGSSLESPLTPGVWGRATVTDHDTSFPVGIQIQSVTRGEAVMDRIRQLQKENLFNAINETIDTEHLDYCIIDYAMYVPEDAPSSVYVMQMQIKGEDGNWIDHSAYGLDDMSTVHPINPVEVHPGETVNASAWFTMDKTRSTYLLQIGDALLSADAFLWIKIV